MKNVRITAKLGTMRKAVDWVVYPDNGSGTIKIQSDTRIALIYPLSKRATLSRSVSSGAYSMHLAPQLGSTEVDVPSDIIAAALAVRPNSGDVVAPGLVIG